MRRERVALCAVSFFLWASCSAKQPDIGCPVQSLEWAAVYKPVELGGCTRKAGEALGIIRYSPETGEETLAIKPASLAALDPRDGAHPSYSLAALPKQADASGFCVVPSLPLQQKEVPEDPVQQLPALRLSYQWSNVRILAIPKAPGTQLLADLVYTENGCTARYEVWGLWPGGVSCDDGSGAPDDSICQMEGTLNPDFVVACEPTLLVCVPGKRPPSLR